MLQVVVGPRQTTHIAAAEQARPVARRHLPQVGDLGRQRAPRDRVAAEPVDQRVERAAGLGGSSLGPERGSDPVDPAERLADRRPGTGRGLQAASQDGAEPLQRAREPPFDATLSRLVATAPSRSRSFNPEASSGGRPSSVRADRIAAQ